MCQIPCNFLWSFPQANNIWILHSTKQNIFELNDCEGLESQISDEDVEAADEADDEERLHTVVVSASRLWHLQLQLS